MKSGNRLAEKATLELPIDLVNQVLSYLQTRPWNEVNGLLQGIIQATELKRQSSELEASMSGAKDEPTTSD